MIHVNTDATAAEIRHVYLEGRARAAARVGLSDDDVAAHSRQSASGGRGNDRRHADHRCTDADQRRRRAGRGDWPWRASLRGRRAHHHRRGRRTVCRRRSKRCSRSTAASSESSACQQDQAQPAGISTRSKTKIKVRDFEIGGDEVTVIAGPCSVEIRRADHGDRPRRQGRRREDPARRRLQAAHLALRVPRARQARPRNPGPGAGGDRPRRSSPR